MPRFFAKCYLNYVLLFIQISFLSCKLGIQSKKKKKATEFVLHIFRMLPSEILDKIIVALREEKQWLKQQFFTSFWNVRKAVVCLTEVQERQLTLKFTSRYHMWSVLHKTTWEYYETTCSPTFPTQTFSLTIHDMRHRTFVHPRESSDIIDLMSTGMTKNTPAEADTLVLLSVCVQVTHIQYCLIRRYAEGRHGSPSLWELVFAAAQDNKKIQPSLAELRADSSLPYFPRHSSHFFPLPHFPHLQPCYPLPSQVFSLLSW